MSVTASIKFVQGASLPPAGESLIGVLSTTVTVSSADNTDVATWEWSTIDKPPGSSAVPLGIFSTANAFTFAPDVRGGYHFQLKVRDINGIESTQRRVFQVAETSGYVIPPFDAMGPSLNFSGNTRGWAKYLEELLRFTLASSGWVSVYDVDFTGLAVSSVAGNGAFVIDGKTWTVANFAAATAMSVGGANGLRISHGVSNTAYDLTTRSGPMFIIPLASISPLIKLGFSVRVWLQILSTNAAAATESMNMAIESNDLDTHRSEFHRYHNGANSRDLLRLIRSGAILSSLDAIDTGGVTDVRIIETPKLALGEVSGWTGLSSGGTFPADSAVNPRARAIATGATSFLNPWIGPSQAYLHLGASTGNVAGTLVVKWKRLRVEIRA